MDNLHISLLTCDRRAQPNVCNSFNEIHWGNYIHQIDESLDTNVIIYQRECSFIEEDEPFEYSYMKLHEEITKLFKKHLLGLLYGDYESLKHEGWGSCHRAREFDKLCKVMPFDYSDDIA